MMVRNYVTAGDEVQKMALRTGMSTTALSELRYAAEILGTDLNTVEVGIKRMAKSLIEASEGSAEYVDAFARINLKAEELIGLSPEQQFHRIAKAIAAVEDPTLRAATAQDIFGRSGTQLLPLFSQGSEGIEALSQKAHELGVVFDEEAANKAAALKDSISTLKASFSGIGNTVASTLVPIITNLATTISNVITKVKAWMDAHPGLTAVLIKVVTVLGILTAVLGPILIVLPALAAGFTMLTGPIGIVTAAIAGLVTVGTLVITHWTEIKEFLASTWMAIQTAAMTVWNAIAGFFTGLWEQIKAIFVGGWEAVKSGFIAFGTGLSEFVQSLVQAIVDKFMWLWSKVREITVWIKDHTIGIFKKMWNEISGHSIVPEMVGQVIENFIRMKTGIGQQMAEISATTEAGFGTVADYAQAMATSGSDSAASFADNLKGSVRSMIKTLEGNAIAYVIAKVMAALPFPANLIAAAGAVAAVKTLFGAIRLAEGGIVTGPTLAMIGEAGPEAVIPLDRPGALAGAGITLKQNNYFYGDIHGIIEVDEISKRLAERTQQAISKGRRY